MKEAQERVRRFHEAMAKVGAALSGYIGDGSDPFIEAGELAFLRSRLLIEECIELCTAMSGMAAVKDIINEALEVMERKPLDDSMDAIADGLADLTVVTLGTAVAAGIYLSPVFDEVMSANERKVGPGARVREDGKLLKPDGWVGPDVAAVLARQRMVRS